MPPQAPIRLGVLDADSGFVTVLAKRAEAAGWQLRHSTGAVPPRDLVAMKLNALLLDPAVAGDEAWDYMDRVASLLPDLGARRLHRPLDRGPAGPRAAARDRRLDHQAGPPGGGDRPDRSGLAPSPPHPPRGRRRRAARRRRSQIRPDRFQAFAAEVNLDLTRREFELLHLLAEERGQVLERETIYQRVWGYAMAHGDRSVDVFIRKLRQKLEKHSPSWSYIHTHFGIGYRFDPEPAGIVEEELRPRPAPPPSRRSTQDLHR